MENWKSIGIFLSGLAAVTTATTAIITTTIKHFNTSIIENKSSVVLQCLAEVNDPDGWVNVRETPSTSSIIKFKLANNNKVSILERNNNWCKVKTPDNQTGYIYYDRLNMLYNDHYIKK